MTQTPEQIAAKLNDAQTRVVKIMSGEFRKLPRGYGYQAHYMSYGDRLTEWEYILPGLKGARRFRLTLLGLAVRAIIMKDEP